VNATAQLLQGVLMIVFLWSMNVGVGMSYTVKEVFAPFRRSVTIALAVALNCLVVPLMYYGLTKVLPMGSDYVIGFLLVGFASAAPAAVKYVGFAEGDIPLSVGLVVLMGALNVIVIPVWSALLMPAGTTINAVQIALTLAVLVLVPLTAGFFIRGRWSEHAHTWAPGAAKVSNLALVLLIVVTLFTSWESVASVFGAWVIAGSLIAICVQMIAGYLIGTDKPSRRALSLVTGVRATGPALAIATAAFSDKPEVIATVIVIAVVSFIPVVVSLEWGRAAKHGTDASAPTADSSAKANTE
jgi:BASS family bile acid:Na+ symporter